MPTQGLNHLKILVTDLERSTRFYERALGMEVIDRRDDRIILTTPGRGDSLTLGLVKEGQEPGLDHFGFFLDDDTDLDEMLQQAEAAGARDFRTVDSHKPTAFFTDPDGFRIQI